MIVNGIEIKNVFPVSSKSNGDGYEIRVAKYIDGKKIAVQETFYNKSNLKDLALITRITEIKKELQNKIATGEAKTKVTKPKKFSEIAEEYLNSKKDKANGYYTGRCKIVRELNVVFGNKYFKQIKRTELEDYVSDQNSKTYGNHVAKVKDAFAKEKLNRTLLDYGVRRLNEEKGISLKVLSKSRGGGNIAYTSAQKICKALGLNMNEIFTDFVDKRFYSDESLESVVETIFAIFDRARIDGQIPFNPIPDYNLFEIVDGLPPQKKDILTKEEYGLFLKRLDELPIHETIAFELLVGTGMRSCEVEGLNWSDICFWRQEIYIRFNRQCKNKKKRKEKLRSKTKSQKSVRTIPMTPRLKRKLTQYRELWEEMKEGNEEFSDCDAVYCDFNGKSKRKEALNGALERILYSDENKIVSDDKWITCHCLRHYWITNLINGGMNPTEVQYLAGHENLSTTMGYFHGQSKEKIAENFLRTYERCNECA